MGDHVVTTGRETADERHRREEAATDQREAMEHPVADRLAQVFHRRVYGRGRAYYPWERMQPEYRRAQRETMRFVVDLVGPDVLADALDAALAPSPEAGE